MIMFWFEEKNNQLTEKLVDRGAETAEGESKQVYYFHPYLAQSTEIKAFYMVVSLELIEKLCSI